MLNARPLILLSAFAAMAGLGLAGCSRDVVEPEVVVIDARVAQIDALDLGRSPGGWILTARARDARGTVERMRFSPAGSAGGVLSFDLETTMSERMSAELGAAMPQVSTAGLFLSDAELAGISAIQVRSASNAQSIAVPQRVSSQ